MPTISVSLADDAKENNDIGIRKNLDTIYNCLYKPYHFAGHSLSGTDGSIGKQGKQNQEEPRHIKHLPVQALRIDAGHTPSGTDSSSSIRRRRVGNRWGCADIPSGLPLSGITRLPDKLYTGREGPKTLQHT